MNCKLIICISLFILVTSCSKRNVPAAVGAGIDDFLASIQNNSGLDKGSYGVIVIPGNACGRCISRLLDNLSRHPDLLENTKMIFTSYISIKGYTLRHGATIFEHINFIDDRSGAIYQYIDQLSAPILVYYSEGMAVKIDVISLKTVDAMFNDFNREYNVKLMNN
jgi:hypothetical protein